MKKAEQIVLYPFIFTPATKDYIWGGRGLEKLGKKLPEGIVAESWEISSHPDGLSIVRNGILAGKSIPELIEEHGTDLLGSSFSESMNHSFPLLVKFIDANDRLSVQVHPNDEYAYLHENGGLGKTEMWVVLHAEPESTIIYGLKPGVTKEQFAKAVEDHCIAGCLNDIPVKAGDYFHIPAGLVHAIGKGIIIAEIQQNSNTTYRVYDYDRKDIHGNSRELHIQKALDVIDFSESMHTPNKIPEKVFVSADAVQTILVENEYFVVERCIVNGSIHSETNGTRFELLIIIEGQAHLSYEATGIDLSLGDSVFIPANIGEFHVSGKYTALRVWVP